MQYTIYKLLSPFEQALLMYKYKLTMGHLLTDEELMVLFIIIMTEYYQAK
ncbi:MAG: hypothetical protein ACTSRI_05000 [Promethearchaeota archaeon]